MNNLQSSYSNEDARIDYFKKLMDPALHLFHAGVIDNLKYFGFFKAPASTKNHGNFEGGLFKHSCNVANVLVKLTKDNGLIWDRSESPYIVGVNGCVRLNGDKKRCRDYDLYERLKWYENVWPAVVQVEIEISLLQGDGAEILLDDLLSRIKWEDENE